MLEYIALSDNQTAVGFLLASTPEQSVRYYRDALCTLALAAGSTSAQRLSRAGGLDGQAEGEQVSRTLHIQAAKVVTAHAASIGDALLGVPLLCSAGVRADPELVHYEICSPSPAPSAGHRTIRIGCGRWARSFPHLLLK
jgi:hypothetical protein